MLAEKPVIHTQERLSNLKAMTILINLIVPFTPMRQDFCLRAPIWLLSRSPMRIPTRPSRLWQSSFHSLG